MSRRGFQRSRGPGSLVVVLSITEVVSWGVLYYAFAVLLVPMQRDLDLSPTELTGAFSLGLLVSGVAGIAVGRHLDQHGPRTLMTCGSAASVLLVIAWSQVQGALGLYIVWIAIGAAMATVLYEPAFVVLAKSFGEPAARRRALTTVTLVGATASFIFLPATQALSDELGWRVALLVLALTLALTTVPLHAGGLPRAAIPVETHAAAGSPAAAGAVVRSIRFWLLAAAFFLVALASLTMTIHAIPFLIERGHEPAFAAFAVGLMGIAQIPGRLLFAPIEAALPPPAATAAVFAFVGIGIVLTVAGGAGAGVVVAGLVLLGMGNGMTTLARASAIADDYGTHAYGAVAGVLAATTTAARAAGPFCGAIVVSLLDYTALLWLLAALSVAAAAFGWQARRLSCAPLAVSR